MPESLHSSQPFVLSQPNSSWTKNCYELIRKLGRGVLQKGKQVGRKSPPEKEISSSLQAEKQLTEAGAKDNKLDPITLFKLQIHSELIKEMDLKKDLTQAKNKASKRELRKKNRSGLLPVLWI